MRIDNLSYFEKDILLMRLLHHLKSDVRGKIIEEHPMIYRKLLNRPADETFKQQMRSAVLRQEEAWVGENDA